MKKKEIKGKVTKKKRPTVKSLPYIIALTEKTMQTYSNIAVIRSGDVDFMIDFSITTPEYIQKIGKFVKLPSIVRIHASPEFIPKLITALQTRYNDYKNKKKRE